jgi:hypothetical protein
MLHCLLNGLRQWFLPWAWGHYNGHPKLLHQLICHFGISLWIPALGSTEISPWGNNNQGLMLAETVVLQSLAGGPVTGLGSE